MGSLEVFSSFFFLFLLFPDMRASQDDCSGVSCSPSRCNSYEPEIRFPFRIKDRQAECCGYPGFDVTCNEKNKTVLHLPSSSELTVGHIYYSKQKLEIYDPDGCIVRRLYMGLNLSSSPFYVNGGHSWIFINCSSRVNDSSLLTPIHCLNNSTYHVYVAAPAFSSEDLPSICGIVKIVQAPRSPYDYFFLHWNVLACQDCEQRHGNCRVVNKTSLETECFNIVSTFKNGASRRLVEGLCVGFSVFGIVATSIAIGVCYRSKRRVKEIQLKIEKFLEDYQSLKPTRYSYRDIRRMTNQFKNKLGQGGYGSVFKGKLSNGIPVAIKILNKSKNEGAEFINEVATIGRIHHVNVVRLLGFCADGSKRALIYEFMRNESLEKFIFSVDAKKPSLGWEKLQDIAVGIARGLEYLHQGCDQRILHFDIKPHNILLDDTFCPKISDFGLAKLYPKGQSVISMTTARGTMGYIAPEVFNMNFGNVSSKSDVYSFGMLLLEIVGGRKNIDVTVDTSQMYFPKWIYNHLNQGEELALMVNTEGETKIARKLAIVALWCIQAYAVDRPSMKSVVQMLEGSTESLIMPPNPFASVIQPTTTKVVPNILTTQN